jgi:hypothetical protein
VVPGSWPRPGFPRRPGMRLALAAGDGGGALAGPCFGLGAAWASGALGCAGGVLRPTGGAWAGPGGAGYLWARAGFRLGALGEPAWGGFGLVAGEGSVRRDAVVWEDRFLRLRAPRPPGTHPGDGGTHHIPQEGAFLAQNIQEQIKGHVDFGPGHQAGVRLDRF